MYFGVFLYFCSLCRCVYTVHTVISRKIVSLFLFSFQLYCGTRSLFRLRSFLHLSLRTCQKLYCRELRRLDLFYCVRIVSCWAGFFLLFCLYAVDGAAKVGGMRLRSLATDIGFGRRAIVMTMYMGQGCSELFIHIFDNIFALINHFIGII